MMRTENITLLRNMKLVLSPSIFDSPNGAAKLPPDITQKIVIYSNRDHQSRTVCVAGAQGQSVLSPRAQNGILDTVFLTK